MSPFFCSTCALSLEVCARARVMKIIRSAHQAIRAWLMNSPPLSQSSPTIGYGSRSATCAMAATTRAWAHTSNDNAHVEQKNGDIVRKSAFRYRYDTPDELALLNELWGYVNLRKNLFLPTRKANGWRSTKAGRNTRTYDEPKTPYQRLTEEAGFLGEETEHRLQELYAQTNPADLTRNINRIQQALIVSAKDKTIALRAEVS